MLNKQPVLDWFLSMGDVLVTVETKADGVDVPKHLYQSETVDFILGKVPTPNLSMDGDGVVAPMRFGGVLHTCVFPWESIRQMASPLAVMHFTKVPTGEAKEDDDKKKGSSKKKGGHLRVVK
jgi:stringent starvation protein B